MSDLRKLQVPTQAGCTEIEVNFEKQERIIEEIASLSNQGLFGQIERKNLMK